MAKLENSWVNVGKLQTGHVLYRLAKDGKSYDLVEIRSIQVKIVKEMDVYGVHLREGERSYHADGYLVAVNYPEITLKSIARVLSKLPKAERVNMLMKIEELAPVFRKIGIRGVSQVLKKEIRGMWDSPLAKKRRIPAARMPLINLNDMRRTFKLEARDSPLTDKNGPPGYELPLLSIYEGVLRTNVDVVPRFEFDADEQRFRWSRKLDGNLGYEHGIFNLTTLGLDGRGAVLITAEENPTEMPTSLEHVVPFAAEKVDVRRDLNKTRAVQSQAPATSPQPAEAQPQPPHLQTLAVAAPSLPTAPGPVIPPTGDDGGYIDNEDFWNVVVDSADWPKDTVRTSALQPVGLGQIGMGTYHTRVGPDGMSIPVIVVPFLDQLLQDVNKGRSGDQVLGSLYDSTVLVNNQGTLTGTVRFRSASTVMSLSDQAPQNEGDPIPVRNLTFKDVGSKVTIPILFSLCQFAFSWDFNDIAGAMYELDPTMTGSIGAR